MSPKPLRQFPALAVIALDDRIVPDGVIALDPAFGVNGFVDLSSLVENNFTALPDGRIVYALHVNVPGGAPGDYGAPPSATRCGFAG